MSNRSFRSTRGNILFLILLAVILFAGLTYAITSSQRGGGNDASGEKMDLAVSDIVNFFAQVDGAVQRMRLSGNIDPTTLDFEVGTNFDADGTNTFSSVNSLNATCTSDACEVFDPAGGGASPRQFARYSPSLIVNIAGASQVAGNIYARPINWPGAATALNDIALVINHMPIALCAAINEKAEITWDTDFYGMNYYIQNPISASRIPSNLSGTNLLTSPIKDAMMGKNMVGDVPNTANPKGCNIYYLLVAR